MESGQVVAGKYRLNQLLGTGGMATVWSATNVFTDRQFAIKFLNPNVAKTPEAAARFLKEAKASARINHPNIIDVLDVGQTEDATLFLVMELLTGVPLEVALRRQQPRMSLHEFCFVMVEVARALAAAHKSGVVHRDLKPSNIFVHKDKSGAAVPKLLDFGVSKFLEDDQNHALTIAGTVLGSPFYMSPEQARGDHRIDGRTDVFAFGAIMFEAMTGTRPYDGANFNQLIVTIATKPPKSIDEFAPDMPASMRAIVRACLEPDRDKRIASFEAVGDMLYNALPELEASPLRLPAPNARLAPQDPDATNAMPVVKPNDRPQASSQSPQYPTQWQTPNPSYSSVAAPGPRAKVPVYLFAAVAVVGLGAVLGMAFSVRSKPAAGSGGNTVITAPTTTTQGTTAAETPTVAKGPGDPPSLSIDSLPAAQHGPVPKGMGRLVLSAAPVACAMSVDGTPKGNTAMASVDLAPGAHQLRCEVPGKPARTASITLTEGQTLKYKFALD